MIRGRNIEQYFNSVGWGSVIIYLRNLADFLRQICFFDAVVQTSAYNLSGSIKNQDFPFIQGLVTIEKRSLICLEQN